jgi:hypothetical protein
LASLSAIAARRSVERPGGIEGRGRVDARNDDDDAARDIEFIRDAQKVEVSEKDAFNPWEQWRGHAGGGTAHGTLCSGRVAIDCRYRIWKKKFVMQDCV